MRTHKRQQLLLSLCSLAADFGEPGRDDNECPHAFAERFLGSSEDMLARNRDHCEIDGIRDLGHRGVAANACDREPLGFTG